MGRKKLPSCNGNGKSRRCVNSWDVVSWISLLTIFSAVFISLSWESLVQVATRNFTEYPVYELNFAQALAERQDRARSYGHAIDDTKVERRSSLSQTEFWDLYDAKWPVLVTDVVPRWPAYRKWTKEYLNKTYGQERVYMTAVKGTIADREGLSLRLTQFVSHTQYSYSNLWTYICDELFIPSKPQLRQDIQGSLYTEEDFFELFPPDIRPWDCMLLWGTAFSRSLLHIDPYNWTGTNAVLWGTKKWKLFPPGQDHLLYVYPNSSCGFPLECNKYNSPVDAFGSEEELRVYPLYRSARYIEVEQKAGEMLFIPTGWFHQAFNSEETLAVSGQMMNRNNFRYVLEEILKAGNLPREQLPEGFHNLPPPDQVRLFMSLLPKEILEKGKALTATNRKLLETGHM